MAKRHNGSHERESGRRFGTPQEIADADHLSRDQKVELLMQWEQDLRQLMTAAGERMIPSGTADAPETLRVVRGLLRSLGADESD